MQLKGARPHADGILLLIVAGSLVLNAFAIWWGLPSLRGWAPDEILPKEVLEGVRVGFMDGWHRDYPPFHFYILAFLYSPMLVLQALDVIDIYALKNITILFYIGRLLSLLMGGGTLILTYLCGREMFDRKSSLYSALIVALSAPFIYYSKMTNLDIPYIFWFMLSLLFYIRVLKHHRMRDYLWFAVTAMVSVCTKDQAYGFYILTPLFMLFALYKERRKEEPKATLTQVLLDKRLTWTLLTAIGVFAFIHNIALNPRGFWGHVQLIVGPGSQPFKVYENSILGHLHMLVTSFEHFIFTFGWPLAVICLAGICLAVVERPRNHLLFCILIPGLSYYLFFVSAILYNYVRFLLPLFIIMAFFGGKLIAGLLNRNRAFFKAKVALVAGVFIFALLYSSKVNLMMAQDSRYHVEAWMYENLDKEAIVAAMGPEEYMPRMQGFDSRRLTYSPPALNKLQPDYIVINSDYARRFLPGSPEHTFYVELIDGKLGYELLFDYARKPGWPSWNLEDILSNFDKISPRIQVLKVQKTN